MSKKDSITKAIDGNQKALKQLINEHRENLYKLIFLHTKYEEDSKEILKNIVYFAKDNIAKLEYEDDFTLWLYKISIININRFLEEEGIVDNIEKVRKYYNGDKINLFKAIDFLSIKYKNVIILKYYYNFSIEEISKILDLNNETIILYIRNALKDIKISVGENLQYGE